VFQFRCVRSIESSDARSFGRRICETSALNQIAFVAILLACCAVAAPLAAGASSFSDVAARGLVFPTAVAPYGEDAYVVADAALQRIFVVQSDGSTKVLAGGGTPNALGSVPGGYADGDGPAARFNTPQGIIADSSGNVYVSDTNNRCIRKISPSGKVSTLTGDPTRTGSHDGSAHDATFGAPRGMVLEPDGSLLVADGFVGIRRVSPSGDVRTLPFLVNTPLDVTLLIGRDLLPIYVVSDINGLYIALPDKTVRRYAIDTRTPKSSDTVGSVPIGHPYAVAGFGTHRVVYTDRFTNVLRVIDLDSSYVQSIPPPADGAAQLSQPLDLSLLPDRDSVVIVDAGRRRLSVLHLDSDRGPFSPSESRAFPAAADPSTMRIALIGNSIVWWATDWPTSIESQAEKLLNARAPQRRFEVLPIFSTAVTAAAQLSYAAEFCDAHMARVVAVNLNSGVVVDSYKFRGLVSSPAATAVWAEPLRAAVTATAAACRAAGVRFVVVVNPLSNEVSSNEDGLRRLLADDLTTDPDAHESYLAALRGLPVIDLWPAFAAAEAANGGNHPALYLTSDAHLSATGRSVFGTAFAEAVERLNNGL
jgi:hypothetical protein